MEKHEQSYTWMRRRFICEPILVLLWTRSCEDLISRITIRPPLHFKRPRGSEAIKHLHSHILECPADRPLLSNPLLEQTKQACWFFIWISLTQMRSSRTKIWYYSVVRFKGRVATCVRGLGDIAENIITILFVLSVNINLHWSFLKTISSLKATYFSN